MVRLEQVTHQDGGRNFVTFVVLGVVRSVRGDRLIKELLNDTHDVQVTVHAWHIPEESIELLETGETWNDLLQGALLALLDGEEVSGWFDTVGGVTDDAGTL